MNPQKSNSNCIIAVDAMGGDFAPQNAVLGAIDALETDSFTLLLLGDRGQIKNVLNTENISFPEDQIIHTTDNISMSESPSSAIRKKRNSSIVVGSRLVKENHAHAFVSAGNTGAVSVAAVFEIGRIRGVERPTITAPFPNSKNSFTFLSDAGAFVDSKPSHLFGFAKLSSKFVEVMYEITNPSIGLLNVGEEDEKGYRLTAETSVLLRNSNLNFFGNIEGKDILKGATDIVICDGFIGNILLKFAESFIPFLKETVRSYADESFTNKIQAGFAKGALKGALKNVNYELYGGLPLLGIDGISIIGHGSSSRLAIKNMVLKAKEMHDKKLVHKITETLG